jgi:hypothetical protein
MEKYGFVYIWYDKKRKMYYIGCHWGTEDDGYVCSSNRMRNAYKRRPGDFRRRIIGKFDNKIEMLINENEWLTLIGKENLGKKYYNLKDCQFNHWSVEEQNSVKIKKTISERTKEAMNKPEIREKYEKGLSKRNTRSSDPEVREKRRKSMLGKNKVKTDKQLEAARNAAKKRIGVPLSKEHKEKIKNTTHFKTLNTLKLKCKYCDFVGNKGNLARYHNEKCKHKKEKLNVII